MPEGSAIQVLKNLCEQERTQILTVLMLSMENPRLVGYMLTGNRSMFLSTDGSLAWLYHCTLIHSPPHVMNQCYGKIPIFYKIAIFFVDPITRPTYPDAKFKIVLTGFRTTFNSIWKMETHGSLIHPLLNTGSVQQYLDRKM